MGSSFATSLGGGCEPETEKKLSEALKLLESALDDLYEAEIDESQFDNAADDGRAQSTLGWAIQMIESLIPKKE